MSSRTKPRRQVFIVGQGRDGSTLLQNLLNNSPRVKISGENIVALQLASALGVLEANPNYWRSKSPEASALGQSHPWFGIDRIELHELVRKLRRIIVNDVLRPGSSEDVIGFKEIRWLDLPKVFEGFQLLFPDAQYIFLERDTSAMMSSGWWSELDNGHEVILKRKAEYKAIAETYGQRAFCLSYERLISDSGVRADLEEFLQIKMDINSWQSTLKMQLRHTKGAAPWHILASRVPLID